MYLKKFAWNCPSCEALNSYCPDIQELDSPIEEFDISLSRQEKAMQLICHYCMSCFIAVFTEDFNLEKLLPYRESFPTTIYFTPIDINEGVYSEDTYNFLQQNGFTLARKVSKLLDTEWYFGFSMADSEEFQRSMYLLVNFDDAIAIGQNTDKFLQIRVRNVFEYDAIIEATTKLYRAYKCVYFLDCNLIISPAIFNECDIIFTFQNKRNTVSISVKTEKIGEDSSGKYVAFPATIRYSEEFQSVLLYIAGYVSE